VTPNAEVDFATLLQVNAFHVTPEHLAMPATLANVTQHAWKSLAPWILNAPTLLKTAIPLTDNANLKHAFQVLTAEQMLVILPPTYAPTAQLAEQQLSIAHLATTAKIQNAWFKDLAVPTTALALTSPKLAIPLQDSVKRNPDAQAQETADQTFATQAMECAKLAQSKPDQLTPREIALPQLLMRTMNTTFVTQKPDSAR